VITEQGLRRVSSTDAGRCRTTSDVDGLDQAGGRHRSLQTSKCCRKRGATEAASGRRGIASWRRQRSRSRARRPDEGSICPATTSRSCCPTTNRQTLITNRVCYVNRRKPFTGTLKPQSNGPLYNNTVIGTLAVDGWAVTFDIARRGLGGLRPRPVPSSLIAVPNAHPSTASVPTLYHSMWHYNCLCTVKS